MMAAQDIKLPAEHADQAYVTISALKGGQVRKRPDSIHPADGLAHFPPQLTLPERNFITNADPEKRTTVPSLCFLIRHQGKKGKQTNLVFDLGLKKKLDGYAPAQQNHITQRQPVIVEPDTADSLRAGGLDPAKDVDVVVLSHVHWDHGMCTQVLSLKSSR